MTVQEQNIARSQLQLVGLVALFLASKIEVRARCQRTVGVRAVGDPCLWCCAYVQESYPPHVKEFAAASAGTHSVAEVKAVEALMIKVCCASQAACLAPSWVLTTAVA